MLGNDMGRTVALPRVGQVALCWRRLRQPNNVRQHAKMINVIAAQPHRL
jgi:hypothetical protein